MKLKSLCSLKTGFATADFWLVRKGSITKIGMPTREFNPEHIGVKVMDTEVLLPDYLFYVFVHLNNIGHFRPLARGTLALKHITISDIANIQFTK